MPVPPVNALVLALNIRPRHVRAALLLPGGEAREAFRLTLPLPVGGADFTGIPALPPDAAGSLPLFPDAAGFTEIPALPLTAAFWQGLLAAAGQPPATAVLAASTGLDDAPAREAFFRRVFASSRGGGVELSALRAGEAPEELLRLRQIQRISQFPAADGFCASILGVLAAPLVQTRVFREGVTILHLEEDRAFAALVFQDKLFAVAERRLRAQGDVPAFLEDLDSFRLGWLPQEKMRDLDGFSVVLPDLPAQAEGFRPLYIAGPGAYRLHGRGVSAAPCGDADETVFRGLLYGFALPGE